MAMLIYTTWALLLNIFGLPIFQTCFANSMEDEDCESLLSGPPFSSVFFSAGIYVLIANCNLFPRTFREPKTIFLAIYEFLAAAFLLEFALACVWTPLDVLLQCTLPTSICHMLRTLGTQDVIIKLLTSRVLMSAVTYIVALTFFLVTFHVTDAVDYTIIRDCGVMPFMLTIKEKLLERIYQELPFLDDTVKQCRCKAYRRRRSRNRSYNSSK